MEANATPGLAPALSPRSQLLYEISLWRSDSWDTDKNLGAFEAADTLQSALDFACLHGWRADRHDRMVCLGKGDDYDPEYSLYCSPREAVELAELLARSEGLVDEFDLRAMVDAACVAAREVAS